MSHGTFIALVIKNIETKRNVKNIHYCFIYITDIINYEYYYFYLEINSS